MKIIMRKREMLLIGLLFSLFAVMAQTRTESDLLGDIQVPADAYYGAQAARAIDNFQISGQYTNNYPDFMKAWGMIKLACARANTDVGELTAAKLKMIEPACQELIKGNYLDQF
ncbi:MAG: lyase family protein, partial [Lutimonas sp.]